MYASYVEEVLDRIQNYERTSLYPQGLSLTARAWLNNFDKNDRIIAAALLDRLTLFSDHAVNCLLKSAFNDLMNSVLPPEEAPFTRRARIEYFLANSFWTHLEGERPNPVDSGYLMCRKLRDQIEIPDNHILSPKDTFNRLQECRNAIFVDDFSGTGNQARETLQRQYDNSQCLLTKASLYDTNIFILLIAATRDAVSFLRSTLGARVACAHVVENNAHINRQEPYPQLPPEVNSGTIREFLEGYSSKLSVPHYMNDSKQKVYGFGKLGLTIAFEHCIPDSTLPIYWAPGPNGWTPLKERR